MGASNCQEKLKSKLKTSLDLSLRATIGAPFEIPVDEPDLKELCALWPRLTPDEKNIIILIVRKGNERK